MTLQQLIDEARRQMKDSATPPLVDDATHIVYANEAEREACRRALLILDATTASVCQYAITGGNALVTLSPKVIKVQRGILVGEALPLSIRGWRQLDQEVSGWESLQGVPTVLIPDWQSGAVLLFRKPIAGATLKLVVHRLPINDMALLTDVPEIPQTDYHLKLVDWMCYRAYMNPDSDAFNPGAGKAHLEAFEAQFGPRPPAINYEQIVRATGRVAHDGPK